MLETLLSFVAPHYCYSCGDVGVLLCNNCKYNIVSESKAACIVCGRLAGKSGICGACRAPYLRAWCVGERRDELQRLIDAYKFERVRGLAKDLAQLLGNTLPELPPDIIVVPVPTIAPHIRQRGYDHSWLLAREFARGRSLACRPLLRRVTSTRQQGADRVTRIAQAKRAFQTKKPVSGGRYLLIDDIVTTGSTLQYATQALLDGGAAEVWVAALAHQPSTK